MSEVFDPEKIERINFRDNWRDPFTGEYVEALDYDKLLALYREAVRDLAQQSKELEFADECLAIKVGAKQ